MTLLDIPPPSDSNRLILAEALEDALDRVCGMNRINTLDATRREAHHIIDQFSMTLLNFSVLILAEMDLKAPIFRLSDELRKSSAFTLFCEEINRLQKTGLLNNTLSKDQMTELINAAVTVKLKAFQCTQAEQDLEKVEQKIRKEINKGAGEQKLLR